MKVFTNRTQAGKLLALRVKQFVCEMPTPPSVSDLVIGLPRGGLPVAAEIATTLAAPLTILVAKKIGAPGQPEFAIGAVSASGLTMVSAAMQPYLPALKQYISNESERLIARSKQLEAQWLQAAGLPQPDFASKRCIIVDDGIATGLTTWAAIETLRRAGAYQVIVAAPVIAAPTKRELEASCDGVISVIAPEDLGAVGAFYQDFHQVEDEEMLHYLRYQVVRTPPVKNIAN